MSSPAMNRKAVSPHVRLFWAAIAGVSLGLLFAIYWLCNQQVRQAGVSEAAIQVQRVALSDCLRHRPHSTVGGCSLQRVPENAAGDGGVVTASRR